MLATAVVLKIRSYPMYHVRDSCALIEVVDLSTIKIGRDTQCKIEDLPNIMRDKDYLGDVANGISVATAR